MATLDVSEVIRDPLFTTQVRFVHREESIDANGNPIYLDANVTDIDAVVTGDLKTISRLPDALQRDGAIVVRAVVTDIPSQFRGGGYDGVIWRGKRFVVVDCADYTQFGEGFLRLVCHPEDATNGNY